MLTCICHSIFGCCAAINGVTQFWKISGVFYMIIIFELRIKSCVSTGSMLITTTMLIYLIRCGLAMSCGAIDLGQQHYVDVIMSAMASQITSPTIVCSTVYSGANQRKHQKAASPAFVREIHRWPVTSPHKGPVSRKMCPFADVIMVA